MDINRDLNTTYRIERDPDGMYHVRHFPTSPKPMFTSKYRFEAMPRWLQEAMHMLDVAAPEKVDGIGVKIGERTYWVEAESVRGDDPDEIRLLINIDRMICTRNEWVANNAARLRAIDPWPEKK